MPLSDAGIAEALNHRDIAISDLDRSNANEWLQPASVDVRLGDSLLLFTDSVDEIDPEQRQSDLMVHHRIPERGFSIRPGEFLLGTTQEALTLGPAFAAMLNGKSSLGRLGLEVHATAGWLDPGFSGKVTLEIKNVNKLPIRLRTGMWIGQFLFFRLDQPAVRPYGSAGLNSRYQNQSDVTASRGWL